MPDHRLAPAAPPPLDELSLEIGAASDYAPLSRFHYLAAAPARPVRVLVARQGTPKPRDGHWGPRPPEPTPVGVLVVSMPTLNSAVRQLAWPGRFRAGDKRADATRVNAEIRTITRVVVDPRWRGLGVARRLVRAYLDDPLTPATEAIAAMGRLCPFFERAGMTAYPLGLRPRDARLADALHHAGIDHRRLVDLDAGRRAAADPWVAGELRLWANGSRATRPLMNDQPGRIAGLAGVRLGAHPIGYAHAWRQDEETMDDRADPGETARGR